MATVLVVDDNADACNLFARLVRACGHEGLSAHSGEEALECLRTALPHLMVLDVMMPGMDGMEVLRHVREDPRTRHLPVVMFSAVADAKFRAHALRKGADDYWVKGSFDFKDLADRLASLVGKQAGGDAGAAE